LHENAKIPYILIKGAFMKTILKVLIYFYLIFLIQFSFALGGSGNDDKGKDSNQQGGDRSQKTGETLRDEKREGDKTFDKGKNEEPKPQTEFQKNISKCTSLTEEIQNMLKKESKKLIKEKIDVNNFKNENDKIKEKVNSIYQETSNLFENLDKEKKADIEKQMKIIEQTKSKINDINASLAKKLSKNDEAKSELLLKYNNDMEKEVNKIDRQLRAIEWLMQSGK
jgi:hypothetical protein